MDQVCVAADLPVYIHPTGTKTLAGSTQKEKWCAGISWTIFIRWEFVPHTTTAAYAINEGI